jgi:hypothetical protein
VTREVSMVTNGGAQAESGIQYIFIVKHAHTIMSFITNFIHPSNCL